MKLPASKKYNVLFIGNSYTYYNNMPEDIFTPFCEAAGYSVSVKKIVKGGWFLRAHADPDDEMGAEVERILTLEKFDFVVLQEQSINPAKDYEDFSDSVRRLIEKIRINGAEPILYSTWGRKEDHPVLSELGWSNETMTWKLASAYEAAGTKYGAEIAHVGLAFFDVYSRNRDLIELYHTDSTHPSLNGSVLAAMTIAARIFGFDPTEVELGLELEDEVAPILASAAKKAASGTPMIPASYRAEVAEK